MAKFSIILPVRNGGEYLKTCVGSILDQRYTDLELLVLDNCSSDGGREWLRSINDDRIKIYPADKPLTIEENWQRALTIPKAEFITLIGHDDWLAPDYLEVMNQLISDNPSASLYQAHFAYIDAQGNSIRTCRPMPPKASAEEFLQLFLENRIDVMGTGFMMRSADYDRLGGIPAYPNLLFADFEIWISLTRLSYLAIASSNCFSFRLHNSMTTTSADLNFLRAYERFIEFLVSLKAMGEPYQEILKKSGPGFLTFYCKGLSHRLLRSPDTERKGLTVREIIGKTRSFGESLGIADLQPESVFSIRLAKWIDSSQITKWMFLKFKKTFKKPILK